MKHDIQWNDVTKEWFCTRCFRTSDHLSREDAERELSQFDCETERGNGNNTPAIVN
jgi:hypothetical protein